MNSMGIPAVGRKVSNAAGVVLNRIVITSGPDKVGYAAAANAAGIAGVVEQVGYDGHDGDDCAVRYLAEADIEVTGAAAVGDACVIGDATGRGQSATPLAAATVVHQVGLFTQPASAAGDVVKVLLTPGVTYTK